MDAKVIALHHAMSLAEKSAGTYQAVQGLRLPTLAVFQATMEAVSRQLSHCMFGAEVSCCAHVV